MHLLRLLGEAAGIAMLLSADRIVYRIFAGTSGRYAFAGFSFT